MSMASYYVNVMYVDVMIDKVPESWKDAKIGCPPVW
jgi:hypothetical protein